MRDVALRVLLVGWAGWAVAPVLPAQEVFKDRVVAIRQPDRPLRVLRVAELRMEPEFAITFNQDGNRGAWQREYVLGHAPACTEALLGGDDGGLAGAVRELEALAGVTGPGQSLIEEELFKVRREIKRREEQREKDKQARLAGVREVLQEVQKTAYAPEKKYSIRELEGVVGKIEGLYAQGAEIRGEIEEVLRPWKTHLEMLQAGKVWRDGAWVGEDEYKVLRQSRAREAREAYLGKLQVDLPADALPDGELKVLMGLMGAGILTTLTLLVLLARASIKGSLTLLQVVVLIGLLSMLGGYGYLAYALANSPKDLAGWSENYLSQDFQLADSHLGWALARAGEVYDEGVAPGHKLALKARDINAFLAQHGRRKESGSLWQVEALAVEFTPRRIRLVEMTRLMGLPVLLQFDLRHVQQEKAMVFDDMRFQVGKWPMPAALGSYILQHGGPQLMKTEDQARLLRYYRVVEIVKDEATVIHEDDLVIVNGQETAPPEKGAPDQKARKQEDAGGGDGKEGTGGG